MKKTQKKYVSGATEANNNKTRKQPITGPLPLNIFLKKQQMIENNIKKNKELYQAETQKQIDTQDPQQVTQKLGNLKKINRRLKDYERDLRNLLANQNAQPVPEPEIIEPPPIPEPEIVDPPVIPHDIQVDETPKAEPEEQPPIPEQEPPQPLSQESLSLASIQIEEPEQDASDKKINEYKKQMEKQQAAEEGGIQDSATNYMYPTYDDRRFQSKIAKRKEFYDNQYLDTPTDIKKQSDLLCKAEFEHLPHQVFVRNFLSPQTPYRSLLLYHQLGTGKTCTAIGVCEEFRQTMKQIGTTKQQRIIIVGSVNVKANFRKQLFDEEKIRKIARDNKGHFDYEDIQLCAASALLKEINPMNLQGIPLDSVIQQVHTLIDQYYSFFGYQSLANYINRYIQFKASDLQRKEYTEEYLKQRRIEKIRQHFNGRLFVIDEAHNLRVTSDNGDENTKKTSMLLLEIAEYADNVRFLLLTATPMYNSPEEVLWWTNLLNTNDRRSTLTRSEIFTNAATNGEDTVDIFKPKDSAKPQFEGGRELLQRKLIGYVSYLRGENPFTFPYRIYPSNFLTEESELRAHTFDDSNRPLIQMNGKPITTPLQHIPVFLTQLDRDSYQYIMYDLCIKYLKQHTFTQKDKFGNQTERKGFEEMGGFGYTLLQIPVECLDIVFPSIPKSVLMSEKVQGGALPVLNNQPIAPNSASAAAPVPFQPEDDEDDEDENENIETSPENQEEGAQETAKNEAREKILRDDPEWIEKKKFLLNSIGEKGIHNTMSWKKIKTTPNEQKTQYEYKPETFKNFGRFLSPQNLPQYSRKISEIQQRILRSTGVILIYSEYIAGGVIPFALALEELGFERHVPVNSRYTNTLFNPQSQDFQKIQKRDALTMRLRNDPIFQTSTAPFKQAKYALITGNSDFSPNNSDDIDLITSPENKLGELVKVVLITRAASEGVDFKFLRQIHILEPWYNMNRIEQILGRGVRNNSHCMLPWEERNVEIYLHGSLLPPPSAAQMIEHSIATGQMEVQTGGADVLQPPSPPEEAADIYIYRIAERKAKKIGQITRLLKETAVDCILNIRQTKFTVQDLEAITANKNLSITLSTDKKEIMYKVGDKPFTDICDYMDNCAFQCMDTTTVAENQVVAQTYNYSHIKSNRPMIMKRIRQLFREEMVFTNKQLIKLIQGSKEYPEVQIYDTLTYFLQNDNETLIDKYGRVGRLTNHGIYYAFLPLELHNTRASLLERGRPIDYKRPFLRFDNSTETIENAATTVPVTESPDTESIKLVNPSDVEQPQLESSFEKKHIQDLFQQTVQKISNWLAYSSINTTLHVQNSNEDKMIKNWFHSIPAAKNILEYLFLLSSPNAQFPTEADYLKYTLYHALDLLTVDEKLSLAYVVFSPSKDTIEFINEQDRTTPIYRNIDAYFQSKFIRGKEKQTALVLAYFDPKTSQSTNHFWSMTLEPAEDIKAKHIGWYRVSETDIPVFFEQAFKTHFEVEVKQIHYKFGFMRFFLSKSKIQTGEVVLNIKNLNQKNRNNKGARVDQASGLNLVNHLQQILGISEAIEFPPAVEKISSIYGLSVAIEFLLRWKDRKVNISINTPSTAISKKYFFTLEETIANKVEKLFCQVDGAMNVITCD